MKILTMPSFGSDMATGTLAQWHVKEGESVSKGDIIASIDTMKGLIDMEVFDNGTIDSLLAGEGEELDIGAPIAQLRLLSENTVSTSNIEKQSVVNIPSTETETETDIDIDATAAADIDAKANNVSQSKQEADTKKEEARTELSQQSQVTQPNKQLLVSPVARKRALELGLDWRQLDHGHGPAGAIILQDIETAENTRVQSSSQSEKSIQPEKSHQPIKSLQLKTVSQPKAIKETKPAPAEMMRQAISANVSRSKREIPHYYLQLDVVLNKALDCLSIHNADLPPSKRVLVNALVYCAIARSLTAFPAFNGFYNDGHYHASEEVHLGNAISLRTGGLIIASIHNAHRLGAIELMDKITDQVTRAREGGLRMSEVQDATVTVSNLGDRGSDSIQSIIFPPQVAIFGIGKPRKMPWIIDDEIVGATIVNISLAADHRVSDGHSGARLLNKINKLLQTPEKLL
jgi:pyruvate dehydrogenase E2 component (dihydrolipoamide acetyltransferase)